VKISGQNKSKDTQRKDTEQIYTLQQC